MKNPVHKNREKFNKPKTFTDRKKEDKRGKGRRFRKSGRRESLQGYGD